MKTRARRSSVYQQRPVFSPPKTRTRRSSMYISAKARADNPEVFSKVWATPIKQPEPIKEASPEKKPAKNPKKIAASPKKTAVSPKKTAASPKKVSSPKKATPALSPPLKTTKSAGNKSISTPRRSSKTPRSAAKQQKSVSKTPAKKVKSPTSASKESVDKAKQSPMKSPAIKTEQTKIKTPSPSKSKLQKPAVVTSTPSKSLEEITGKTFYGTPGETPIQNKRDDEVFVFSAGPTKSAKRPARKSVAQTPRSAKAVKTTKSAKKSPVKKSPVKKTPATKRRRDSDIESSPATNKRTKTAEVSSASPQKRVTKSAKRKVVKAETSKQVEPSIPDSIPFEKMSPVQMSSLLTSVKKESKKRKASLSPVQQKVKQAKLVDENFEAPTPRVFKQAKRTSPKKLAEIVEKNQSNNNQGTVGDVSILNETISTDSRSGRCIIL